MYRKIDSVASLPCRFTFRIKEERIDRYYGTKRWLIEDICTGKEYYIRKPKSYIFQGYGASDTISVYTVTENSISRLEMEILL